MITDMAHEVVHVLGSVAKVTSFSAGSMAHIDELGGGDTPKELLATIG
jgi:hypothetical protein